MASTVDLPGGGSACWPHVSEAERRSAALPSRLGSAPPRVVYRDLGSVIQPGGKLVTVWAAEADFDAAGAVSNTFELEWPPGSGQLRSFPEIDKASWFTVEVARVKLIRGQRPLIDRLLQMFGNLT